MNVDPDKAQRAYIELRYLVLNAPLKLACTQGGVNLGACTCPGCVLRAQLARDLFEVGNEVDVVLTFWTDPKRQAPYCKVTIEGLSSVFWPLVHPRRGTIEPTTLAEAAEGPFKDRWTLMGVDWKARMPNELLVDVVKSLLGSGRRGRVRYFPGIVDPNGPYQKRFPTAVLLSIEPPEVP